MEPNFKLKISADADRDLAALYEYGFTQWGEEQADRYFDALLTHLEQLCKNPLLYAAVDYIRPGYRRSVCGSHSIYYRVVADYVEVMAIIGKRDITARL